MAVERGLSVRLFVDDMDSFKAIVPEPDKGVIVEHWPKENYQAADVVIEAFACSLPDNVIQAIVQKQSIWIDLEYLSAEDWVVGCHAIPSQHPQFKIKKTLFFPGFDTRTGGVIREDDIISRRNAFLKDINAQNLWRKAHFIPETDEKTIDISLFCYQTAPVDAFFGFLEGLDRQVRVFRPVRNWIPAFAGMTIKQIKNVVIYDIPFLSQHDYDYLLWTCDFNCVRGEDSFVRAQISGKPFLWNIYVQERQAHLVKLHAFLDKIKPFYDAESFERLAYLHDLWNEDAQIRQDWKRMRFQNLESFGAGARNWSENLVSQTDLVTQILNFAQKQKRL
jgi:uncharacterized repeat protein (TIGR03837 family)